MEMSYKKWIKKFKPIGVSNDNINGIPDIYSSPQEILNENNWRSLSHIWSYCSADDGGEYIVNEIRHANNIGYIGTTKCHYSYEQIFINDVPEKKYTFHLP